MSGMTPVDFTEHTFAFQFLDAFTAGQVLAFLSGRHDDRYEIEYVAAGRESHWRPPWESDRSNGRLLSGAPEYLVLIDTWYDSKRMPTGQRHKLVPVKSWLVFPSQFNESVRIMTPEQFKERCEIVNTNPSDVVQ